MAGSRFNFLYTTDAGVKYWISMDKSNALAVGNVTYDGSVPDSVPRNIKPRYARFRSNDGLHSIKVPIGTSTQAVPSKIQSYDAVDCFYKGLTGEKRKIATTQDTGLVNP
jgi:hypothetical protein